MGPSIISHTFQCSSGVGPPGQCAPSVGPPGQCAPSIGPPGQCAPSVGPPGQCDPNPSVGCADSGYPSLRTGYTGRMDRMQRQR